MSRLIDRITVDKSVYRPNHPKMHLAPGLNECIGLFPLFEVASIQCVCSSLKHKQVSTKPLWRRSRLLTGFRSKPTLADPGLFDLDVMRYVFDKFVNSRLVLFTRCQPGRMQQLNNRQLLQN
jgi:hypothetical protein